MIYFIFFFSFNHSYGFSYKKIIHRASSMSYCYAIATRLVRFRRLRLNVLTKKKTRPSEIAKTCFNITGEEPCLWFPQFDLGSRTECQCTLKPSVSRYLWGEWTVPYVLSIMFGWATPIITVSAPYDLHILESEISCFLKSLVLVLGTQILWTTLARRTNEHRALLLHRGNCQDWAFSG